MKNVENKPSNKNKHNLDLSQQHSKMPLTQSARARNGRKRGSASSLHGIHKKHKLHHRKSTPNLRKARLTEILKRLNFLAQTKVYLIWKKHQS